MKMEAIVHSLHDAAMVEIVEHTDNNHCLARYDGKLCTAIFKLYRRIALKRPKLSCIAFLRRDRVISLPF